MVDFDNVHGGKWLSPGHLANLVALGRPNTSGSSMRHAMDIDSKENERVQQREAHESDAEVNGMLVLAAEKAHLGQTEGDLDVKVSAVGSKVNANPISALSIVEQQAATKDAKTQQEATKDAK